MRKGRTDLQVRPLPYTSAIERVSVDLTFGDIDRKYEMVSFSC
jgi:hypothetical protein